MTDPAHIRAKEDAHRSRVLSALDTMDHAVALRDKAASGELTSRFKKRATRCPRPPGRNRGDRPPCLQEARPGPHGARPSFARAATTWPNYKRSATEQVHLHDADPRNARRRSRRNSVA
jgi:hypothetical protein